MVWEIRWPGLDLPSCRCPSGRGELPGERFSEKILQSQGRGWVKPGLVPCFGVFEGWWYGSCGVRELGCMNYGSLHRQQETICAGKDKSKRFLQQTMWTLWCLIRVVLTFEPNRTFISSLSLLHATKPGDFYCPKVVSETGHKLQKWLDGRKMPKLSPPQLVFPVQERQQGCAMQHRCPSLATEDYRLVPNRRIVGVNPT